MLFCKCKYKYYILYSFYLGNQTSKGKERSRDERPERIYVISTIPQSDSLGQLIELEKLNDTAEEVNANRRSSGTDTMKGDRKGNLFSALCKEHIITDSSCNGESDKNLDDFIEEWMARKNPSKTLERDDPNAEIAKRRTHIEKKFTKIKPRKGKSP